MTLAEINNKFDQLYDGIDSKQAPGLNMYEKSMFLTQALKELVKEIIPELDKSEKKTRELDRLIVNVYIDFDPSFDATFAGVKINVNSRIFELPSDVWEIKEERIYTTATNSIRVTPKTLDEYNILINNRFRKPSSYEAWRMNVKDTVSTTEKHIIEIICLTTPVKYQLRYIKHPKPIILENLVGYTIDGISTASLPEVSSELHETIVKRAVLLAVEAYKPQSLETKMVVTNREN